jgi:hypothetical protein
MFAGLAFGRPTDAERPLPELSLKMGNRRFTRLTNITDHAWSLEEIAAILDNSKQSTIQL